MKTKDLYELYLLVIILFQLLLVIGCSKNDDGQILYPDIALNKYELTLEEGKSERLIASFTPAETPDKGHVWSSSVPSVAMVDETGMITAVKPGEAIITVTALAGKKKVFCRVKVVDKIVNVTGVTVKPTEVKLVVGDELKLEATVMPENATNKSVVWTSSDGKLATVDGIGKVTAIAKGKVAIKATSKDGDIVASCQITVVSKGVEISKPEVSNVISISAIITGRVEPLGVKLDEVGICYSTSQSPTVEAKKVVLSGENLSYTLTKLEAKTTYYVRIYAIVDGVARYGDQAMFTTEVEVKISVPTISSITSNAAYVSGTIQTYGIPTEEVGICYSVSSMPTVDDTKVVLSGNSIGYTLNELEPEMFYFIRIFVRLKGIYYYGDQIKFATTGRLKTHFEPTDIYEERIELKSSAPRGISKVDVCYGISPNPKITDNITTASVGTDGKLQLSLVGLNKGTTYYLRAYSSIGSKIEYYNDEVSVQTIGRSFSYSCGERWDKYESYGRNETWPYKKKYCIYFTCAYDIAKAGTYLVKSYSYSVSFSKTEAYTKNIYIEKGTGSFKLKREEGYWTFEGTSIDFPSGEIVFENIENSLRYHIILPTRYYMGFSEPD